LGTTSRDPVGLLYERHADANRSSRVRCRNEVWGGDAAPGAVAERDRGFWSLYRMKMYAR